MQITGERGMSSAGVAVEARRNQVSQVESTINESMPVSKPVIKLARSSSGIIDKCLNSYLKKTNKLPFHDMNVKRRLDNIVTLCCSQQHVAVNKFTGRRSGLVSIRGLMGCV